MKMKTKLLIVEDEAPQRERLLGITQAPPPEWCRETGVAAFDVEAVATAQEARSKLQQAESEEQMFEVVLLDLKLPERREDVIRHKKSVQVGLNLLTQIRSQYGAAVVVLTAWPQPKNIIHCLRSGATDFLIKPLDRESQRMLFIRLIKSVGVIREQLHRKLKWERLFKHQVLALQKERGEIAKTVTDAAHLVSERLEKLGKTLSRQYGLDPERDEANPIIKELNAVSRALDNTVKIVWRHPFETETPPSLTLVNVKSLIEEEIARVMPCFLHFDVALELSITGELKTKSVEPDLRAMVAEMLFGTLEFSAKGASTKLSANLGRGRNDIELTIVYQGNPVSKSVKASVEQGRMPLSELGLVDQSYCYIWSLARNIGVRLEVGRQGKDAFMRLIIPVINE